jgi:hypothetical protein
MPYSLPTFLLRIALPVLLLPALLSGCTLIGFGAGYLAEPDATRPSPSALRTRIPAGQVVTVVDTAGTRHHGTYLRLGELPAPRDSVAYATMQDQQQAWYKGGLRALPAWGAPVTLETTASYRQTSAPAPGPSASDSSTDTPAAVQGAFVGFGLAETPRLDYVRVRQADGTVARVPLGAIRRMRIGRYAYDGTVLRGALEERSSLPSVTALVLEPEDGPPLQVPLAAVEVIEGLRSSRGRWIGLGIGLAVDLVVLVLISRELSGPYSVPFEVYQ